MKFLVRLVILALLFTYAFPAFVPGVAISGGFWPHGVGAGFLFACVSFLFGLLAAFATVATLGIGLIVLFFLQMFIPAVILQVMSSWFPDLLTVANWESAIVAGLCIWVVNFVIGRLGSSK